MSEEKLLKVCTKCGESKEATTDNFRKKTKGKYGLRSTCKECDKQYDREYNKQYRENKKQYDREYSKQYRENNKQYVNEYGRQYRKNLKSQGKGITTKQYKEMMNFFDWKCAYSGMPYKKYAIHKDYILPIAKGGLNEIWNIAPMYKNYNSSKYDKLDVMNWYKEQEYYSEERLAKIVEWQQYAYDKWATEDDDPLILITDLYTGDDDIWLEK